MHNLDLVKCGICLLNCLIPNEDCNLPVGLAKTFPFPLPLIRLSPLPPPPPSLFLQLLHTEGAFCMAYASQ